jgi:error-prone DNA polymerase
MDLLFERFISRERNEAPDIDVDFEHERREEVLQYIYEKYGRQRAGMTAAVITYRIRSAVRDTGKALGISLDRIDALSKILEGRGGNESLAQRCSQSGIDPNSDIGKRFLYLVESLIGFPRHLSQHTGGMVMTEGLLCELCPIENASMEGRTVIQWDKDDLDALGILKVDCLALGMLTAIHKSFDFIENNYAKPLTLANVPQGDQAVYDMICKADTLGVFQIESRAQMSMLPRLKPRCFYDLVIEVAIVRPGPIQGQMVHPYLTARATGIQPEYPTPEIGQVLAKTLGVPIFQEQAMRLAVVAAGFTPGEADQLRRAMAAWRRPGVIDQFKQKLLNGMRDRGLSEQFAENVFTQLRGFGEYGFPESHAASFALLVYVSCWLKHYYPQVFCAAMLNSQPLGFYSPSQLVQCARNHHVQCLPPDINRSDWDCTLEPNQSQKNQTPGNQTIPHHVRLGLRMITGLGESVARKIVDHRKAHGPYRDTNDLSTRTRVGSSVIAQLASSGAIDSISGNRRSAYWQSLGVERSGKELPLFEQSSVSDDDLVPESLRPMTDLEEVYTDYSTTGLSLRGHPIGFCREKLNQLRVTPADKIASVPSGRFIRVAGLIVLRQRPGTAKGITFVTLEDETGSINLIVKPQIWKQFYLVCKQSNAWLVHGVLESRQNVIHVVVGRIEDLSQEIRGFDIDSRDFR